MGEREQAELDRLHRLISRHVPDAGQATSYGMPCHTYRGKPVAAVVVRKKHIAWYPFSSRVLSQCEDQLTGLSTSPGTLRFTADHPLPDDLVKRLLDLRMREIDEKTDL